MSGSPPLAFLWYKFAGRTMRRTLSAAALCLAALCDAEASASDSAEGADDPAPVAAEQLDGRAFPHHVLALTWDDGPDRNTLELARYLAKERVGATFFVVHEWADHLADDPGVGERVSETGY